MTKHTEIIIFTSLCVGIFIFYLLYANLSVDTILLFLASKLYLGHWLQQGIFPLFNPYIFTGIPFAFDVGLGNLHPTNLLFLLPFPLSAASWVTLHSAIFLAGYFLLFKKLSKQTAVAFFLTIVLFFSGTGLYKMNNPTIFGVIAHIGLFVYSLSYVQKNNWKSFSFPLIAGMLLTLSGHIQMVFIGYLVGFLIAVFLLRIHIKKILLYFFILFISTLWYFILAAPQIIESTRVGFRAAQEMSVAPLQFVQIFVPYIFGHASNGSTWNAGPIPDIMISIIFLPFLLAVLWNKKRLVPIIIIFGIFLSTAGAISIPFLRTSTHSLAILHIYGLSLIAVYWNDVISFIQKFERFQKLLIPSMILITLFAVGNLLGVFSNSFTFLYTTVKGSIQSLFFDTETINAIGRLVGISALQYAALLATIVLGIKYRKYFLRIISIYVLAEGIFAIFLTSVFIPTSVISTKLSNHQNLDVVNFRVQSASEVVPYHGLSTYVDSARFQPPFSKESPFFDQNERGSYTKLAQLFEDIPASWGQVYGMKTVQGYSTFVPKKIALYFDKPSSDFEETYAEIISRNSHFKNAYTGTHTNAIEASQITLHDPRWGELGVRYTIAQNSQWSENVSARPIFELIHSDGSSRVKNPIQENPNEITFQIKPKDIGRDLEIHMLPGGFVAELDGVSLSIKKKDMSFKIHLISAGILKVKYSPAEHVKETLLGLK